MSDQSSQTSSSPADTSAIEARLVPAEVPDDFGFTEDHAMLRDTARRLMAEKCPFTEIRRLVDDDDGFDRGLARELAELGWTGLLVPEQYGGAELDFLSMALILEETGRALMPGPLSSTVLAGLAIDLAGSEEQKKTWLPGLASGEIAATVGFSEPGGSWSPEAVSATATQEAADGDYRLDGVKTHVLWANHSALLVAPFLIDGDVALFALPCGASDLPAGMTIADESSVDSTRRTGRVTFDGASVPASARLTRGSAKSWRALHVRGYALLAAEMLGAAEAILGRTRDYACERVQFDRPIGSFQAVKHPLVDVLIAIERARSLVAGAVAALDSSPDQAEIPARMAKAATTHALRFAADRGVQLHGGYGFTWDCDAHFFFKRALWSAATLGDETHHRRHLAGSLFA